MSKYYRVRTQEQWEWLVNRFGQSETQWPEQGMHFGEICECLASGGSVIVHYDYFPSVGSVLYTTTPQNNGNVIEVSDLMEGEKMEYEDYVTIKGENLGKAKLLVQQKVKMTQAEKKEFDELKRHRGTVYGALDMIEDDYPKLYTRLFGNSSHEGDNKAQLEFARAWTDESLIEVIPEKKWNVKIFNSDDAIYWKKQDGSLTVATIDLTDSDRTQFTAEELKHYGLDKDIFEKIEVGDAKEN